MKTILRCENIKKTYTGQYVSTEVLMGITENFEESSINLVYGKSGSGKSTFLKLLAGIDAPTNGEVYFEDLKYSSLKEHELAKLRGRNYGFIFQNYNLIPKSNVFENICIPSYINNIKIENEYKDYLLETIGIKDLMSKMPTELSGGQQQRVAIARALILKPKIVFADEPTGNLDSENTKIISSLLKDINKEFGTTIIVVTHEKDLITPCHKALTISDGTIKNE